MPVCRSPNAARRINVANVGAAAVTGSAGVGASVPTSNSSVSPSALATGKHRSRSPTPQRKFLNQSNAMVNAAAVGNGNAEQGLPLGSPHLVRRSMSPSQRRLMGDMRRKQNSLESYGNSSGPKSLPGADFVEETNATGVAANTITTTSSGQSVVAGQPEQSSKFENISDNGSEISDEGYRSLGVIQSTAQKRESLHSQASIEDAESNGK